MRKFFILAALLLGSAQAATLVVTEQTRVFAQTAIYCANGSSTCAASDSETDQSGTVSSSSSNFAGFADSDATLIWSWDGSNLQVDGEVNTTAQALDVFNLESRADADAGSYFYSDIFLDQSYFYSGSFSLLGGAGKSFDLIENGVPIITHGGCASPCTFSGILEAGAHRLVIFEQASEANGNGLLEGEYGTFSASLSLVPVPIPAAAWLFGSALFGLGWFGRKTQ